MKKITLLIIALITNTLIAQDNCESTEHDFEDLNSITKCIIAPSKKADGKETRQISVNISAPKKRYLKKRVLVKKQIVSNINHLNTSGISKTQHNVDISNSLEIRKEDSVINNVLALSNTLSKDELKKAVKFDAASTIPQFSSCKGKKENLNCFNTEMIKHIEKHFNYPNEAVIKKIEGKVWVRFVIDTDGNVSNIKTLGPKGGKVLDNEAIRVITQLPKFTPGKNNGKKVSVKYGFPISFSLDQ